jgi:hypothetical protein
MLFISRTPLRDPPEKPGTGGLRTLSPFCRQNADAHRASGPASPFRRKTSVYGFSTALFFAVSTIIAFAGNACKGRRAAAPEPKGRSALPETEAEPSATDAQVPPSDIDTADGKIKNPPSLSSRPFRQLVRRHGGGMNIDFIGSRISLDKSTGIFLRYSHN